MAWLASIAIAFAAPSGLKRRADDGVTLTAHDRPLRETCGCLGVLRILVQGMS